MGIKEVVYELEETPPADIGTDASNPFGDLVRQRPAVDANALFFSQVMDEATMAGAGVVVTPLHAAEHKNDPLATMVHGMSLKHGHYYRVIAHATNRVGRPLSWNMIDGTVIEENAPCVSNQILVDATPPVLGSMAICRFAIDCDPMAETLPPSTPYQMWDNTFIVGTRDTYDDESGMYQYDAAVSKTFPRRPLPPIAFSRLC